MNDILYGWPYFTRVQWFKIPLALRKWWWEETDYGKNPPSDDLKAALETAVKLDDAGHKA